MKTIKQPPGSALCMACCVAMILDMSLDEVIIAAELEKTDEFDFIDPRYMGVINAYRFLASHGVMLGGWMQWEPSVELPNHLEEIQTSYFMDKQDFIVSVESKNYEGALHAVVWDHETRMIRDPSPKEDELTALSSYKVVQAIPITRLT